jgi:hypothetical protein
LGSRGPLYLGGLANPLQEVFLFYYGAVHSSHINHYDYQIVSSNAQWFCHIVITKKLQPPQKKQLLTLGNNHLVGQYNPRYAK